MGVLPIEPVFHVGRGAIGWFMFSGARFFAFGPKLTPLNTCVKLLSDSGVNAFQTAGTARHRM